jgi:hypothetical protein
LLDEVVAARHEHKLSGNKEKAVHGACWWVVES